MEPNSPLHGLLLVCLLVVCGLSLFFVIVLVRGGGAREIRGRGEERGGQGDQIDERESSLRERYFVLSFLFCSYSFIFPSFFFSSGDIPFVRIDIQVSSLMQQAQDKNKKKYVLVADKVASDKTGAGSCMPLPLLFPLLPFPLLSSPLLFLIFSLQIRGRYPKTSCSCTTSTPTTSFVSLTLPPTTKTTKANSRPK